MDVIEIIVKMQKKVGMGGRVHWESSQEGLGGGSGKGGKGLNGWI